MASLESPGVALWDTASGLYKARESRRVDHRRGGQRFPALFAKYPNITHVFFNGSKAETAFRRHVLPALLQDRYVFARLPSTSPAHAAMRLEAKVQAWSVVKEVLS